MSDGRVSARIDRLVKEEQELRQRRVREEFGLDPDDAEARSAETVEHYGQ